MDFLNKLGEKANKTYKVTAEKTSKLAKEAKLRMKISDTENEIQSIYREIGRKVYEKYSSEGSVCVKEEIVEECTKIDVLAAEIEAALKESRELKNKKQCSKCFAEIDKAAVYCPSCGEKQEVVEEDDVKEAEVIMEATGVDEEIPAENNDENK